MKKLLLIIGIVSIITCVLFLLFALLNMHAYYNLYDGTAEHNKMNISFVIGIVLAVIGTVCIIIRAKI